MRRIYFMLFILGVLVISCNSNPDLITLDAKNPALVVNNGVLNFNNKSFSGVLESSHQNNQLEYSCSYLNGRKNGLEQRWYKDGVLLEERSYTNGLKTGVHKGWWQNSIPKFEYVFDANGSYHGEIKEWYKTGTLYKKFNYKHGKEIGSQKLWKYDGAIKANYEVVNGERFGLIGLKKCYKVTNGSNEIK